jgi:hypothetical protein
MKVGSSYGSYLTDKNGREIVTSDPIRYERRFWLLAEALKLAPLGEALQLAKSAEAWLISDERQAESEQLLMSLSNARSPYLN